MSWTFDNNKPIYLQIMDKIKLQIISHKLEPSQQLPTVRELASEAGVNPNTIQRAYMQLEQEGLIYPVKGRGNFIAQSEEIRRISIESYEKELKALVCKGKNLGIQEEEQIHIVRTCYEEGDL